MKQDVSGFRKPNSVERIFNKVFGILVGLGLGLPHNYLLQVRGRKTGHVYSTPVNLLEFRGRRFLVAGRGHTQWVQNAEAVGEIILKKASNRQRFRVRALPNEEKPEILKAYLDRFKVTVQRYFPVPAGSEPHAFGGVADRYPVFELFPSDHPLERAGAPPATQH
jgi:deazaflavin-dependent oxidoreductase (nitroreductase family)